MCSAVREEVVNDHSTDREDKHQHTPEELGEDFAIRLEHFDYKSNYISIMINQAQNVIRPLAREVAQLLKGCDGAKEKAGKEGGNVLKIMISRIKTMNPMIPPPVPYFHAFSCTASVDIGAASAEAARRRKLRAAWKVYIFAVLCRLVWCGVSGIA